MCSSDLFGSSFFIAFLLGIGLPAWWLGYLALLARPVGNGSLEGLEWYPVGHLVTWAAILSAAVVIGAMLSLGTDMETFRDALRKGFERMLDLKGRGSAGTPTARQEGLSRLVEFLVIALPPAAAVLTTIISVVNLWIAERIVKISGRLKRPPSDLSAMHFPVYAPALTGVAIAGSFLPGMIGVIAGVLGASMLMAYAILGFAVLHAITRGMNSRPFTLGGTYAVVIIFGWPMLGMALLGLADTAFDIRGRVAQKRGPHNPQS